LFDLATRGDAAFAARDVHHHSREIDIISISADNYVTDMDALKALLESLSKESVYRVKGVLPNGSGKAEILNWAFERYTMTPLLSSETHMLEVTVMGVDLRGLIPRFKGAFPAAKLTFSAAS
jgi:G3E family GTPase